MDTMTLRTNLIAALVPRYTSYPTAPHFDDGVTAQTFLGWISALPPAEPVSLYFHIPFCDSLCWFCGCHTSVVNAYAPVKAYVDVLLKELDGVLPWPGKKRLDQQQAPSVPHPLECSCQR